MTVVVRVDDLVIFGSKEARERILQDLSADLSLKFVHHIERPGAKGTLLGRTLMKTEKGFAILNDTHYSQELAGVFGLCRPGKTSKEVTTRIAQNDREEDGEVLAADQAS